MRQRGCARCDHIETEVIEAIGHSFTDYISDGNATIESDGTKTAHCDNGCGAIDTVVDQGSQLVSEITSDIFETTEEFIFDIAVGMTVQQLLGGLHDDSHVAVFEDDAQLELTAPLATGMILRLVVNGQVMQELEIVVSGDTSGDGKISVTDMIAIKAHVLKKTILTGAAAKAADVSGDGAISITDFIQVKSHILGKSQVMNLAESQQDCVTLKRNVVALPAQPVLMQRRALPHIRISCGDFLVPGRRDFLERRTFDKRG